jgi:hypothetical protein
VRSKRGINTLRKKKLSNKTAAQRCVWRFYTVTLKNSLNRRFLRQFRIAGGRSISLSPAHERAYTKFLGQKFDVFLQQYD